MHCALREKCGIEGILNLREYHSDDEAAQGTNLKLYRVKISVGSIRDEQVTEALRIIRESEGPIAVHCHPAPISHSTGMVRVVYSGFLPSFCTQEFSRKEGFVANVSPTISNYGSCPAFAFLK
jgi:tyrosine-protein phosphatase SIW14